MRTRTSLAAAAMAVVVTAATVVPANAQSAGEAQANDSSVSTQANDSSINTEATASSGNCIAVGLAAGLPLLLLLPVGIGASVNIPGIENLNTQIQAQLGLFNKDVARQFEQFKSQIGAAAGIAGAALGVAAAVYLAQNCFGADNKTGSSAGSSAADNGSSAIDSGSSAADSGSSILDEGSSTLEGSSTEGQDGSSTEGDNGSSTDGSSTEGDNGSSLPGTEGDGSSLDGSSTTAPAQEATAGTDVNINLATLLKLAAGVEITAVEGLPAGLSFNAETKTITGTPTTAGEHTVKVTTKVLGIESTASFKINVAAAA